MDKRKVIAIISFVLALVGLIVSLVAKIDFAVSGLFSNQKFEIKNVVMGGWSHLTFGTIIAFVCALVNLTIVDANKRFRFAELALAALMLVGAICLFCYDQNNAELAALKKAYEKSTTSTDSAGCVVAGIMYILSAVLTLITAFMEVEDYTLSPVAYYQNDDDLGIKETKSQVEKTIKKEEPIEEVKTEEKEENKEEVEEVSEEENSEDVQENSTEEDDFIKEEESLAAMLEKERFQEEEITQVINLELSDVQVIGDMITIKRVTTYNTKFVHNVVLKRNLLSFVFFGKQYNAKTNSLDFDEAKAIYDALIKYSTK